MTSRDLGLMTVGLVVCSQWHARAESVPDSLACSCEAAIGVLNVELTALEGQAEALSSQSTGLVGFDSSETTLGILIGLQQYAYKTSFLFYSKPLGTTYTVEDEGEVPLSGVYFDGPECTGNAVGLGNPPLAADVLGNAYVYEPLASNYLLPGIQSVLNSDGVCEAKAFPDGAFAFPMKKVPLPFDIPVPLPVTIKGGE